MLGDINEICIFDAAEVPSDQNSTDVLPEFVKLTLTNTEILQESCAAEQAPNMWMNLVRSAHCKYILDVAHQYFRKRLRQQLRRTAILVSGSESDVSHNAPEWRNFLSSFCFLPSESPCFILFYLGYLGLSALF